MLKPCARLTNVVIALALLGMTAPGHAQAKTETSTGMKKVGDTVEGVVQQPLKDLNLMKPKVPPYLEAIMAKPYSLKGLASCAQYKAEIGRLDPLLGADVDSIQATKKGENPAEFALSAGASVAGSLIPGGGLIRKISGAQKAQNHATAAVLAGSLRRAFVKGTARAKGCKLS